MLTSLANEAPESEQLLPSRSPPPARPLRSRKSIHQVAPAHVTLDTHYVTPALCLMRRRGCCPAHEEGLQVWGGHLDGSKAPQSLISQPTCEPIAFKLCPKVVR